MAADFTIADVLAWARTKPADERYNYGDNSNCALCQFLRETDRCAAPRAGGNYWRDANAAYQEIGFSDGLAVALQDGTFGGLVARLETLCPETPITKSDWLAIDAYMADIESVSA